MQLSKTFLLAFVILSSTTLAKDYGCSDKHEGEMHCVGKYHRNLKQCFKAKWRVYTCPKGCVPMPQAHCSEVMTSGWKRDAGMVDWDPSSMSMDWNDLEPKNSTVGNGTVGAETSAPMGATSLKRYAYQGHV
jgi:hypothetical protein